MITERHQADKREEKTNRSGYKMQQLNKEQSGQKKLPKSFHKKLPQRERNLPSVEAGLHGQHMPYHLSLCSVKRDSLLT